MLRIAFYNVRGLHDGADRVADVVAALDADVLAVAEPARGPTGRRRMRRVAVAAGLVPVTSGGGARTTALFARAGLPVAGARAVRLPWRPGRTRRGFAMADVAGVQVLAVHLGLRATERRSHVEHVLAAIDATRPVIVAADLNEQPGGGAWRRLTGPLTDLTAGAGPTYPAHQPRLRIDVVLGGHVRAVGAARVVDDESARLASDHLPLVVEISAEAGSGVVGEAAADPPAASH